MSLDTTAEKLKLIELYKIELADSTIYYFTDFEKGDKFIFDSGTYEPIPLQSEPIQRNSNFAVSEKTVTVPRHSDYVTTADLFERYLDNAVLYYYVVDRDNVANYKLAFKGIAGRVAYNFHSVSITFMDKFNLHRKQIPRYLYQESCPYRLFSTKCGLTKATWKTSGTVDSATSDTMTDAALTEADDYWNFGYIEMTSGAADGDKRMIVDFDAGTDKITILRPWTTTPSGGDTYDIYPHCQKKYTLCDSIFSNSDNYGGCMHIPRPEESLI